MRILFVSAMLSLAVPAPAQTPAREPDTLQLLLNEVHQLRVAMEVTTIASQRVQIALTTLQLQQTAVARAAQRLDDLTKRCQPTRDDKQRLAALVARFETSVSITASAEENAAMRHALPGVKVQLESRTAEVQTCEATESEAAAQLRTEQAALSELRDRIDRLDKELAKLSAPGR